MTGFERRGSEWKSCGLPEPRLTEASAEISNPVTSTTFPSQTKSKLNSTVALLCGFTFIFHPTQSSFDKLNRIRYNIMSVVRKEENVLFTVVDLFAGAGGLSYGFERTGQFRIVAAAEKNPSIRKTYKRNHRNVLLYEDVSEINYKDISDSFGSIDLVIGGPPCQGFSNANRQHTTLISMNNRLVKEYVRAICELKPRVFLMENVAMLRSQVHRFIVDEVDYRSGFCDKVETTEDQIEILPADSVFDGALALAQGMNMDETNQWDDKRYKVLNVLYRYRINQAKFENTIEKHRTYLLKELPWIIEQEGDDPILVADRAMASTLLRYINGDSVSFNSVIAAMKQPIFTQRMLQQLRELRENDIHVYKFCEDAGAIVARVKSYAVLDYIYGILGTDPYSYRITAEVYNAADYGAPQKRERFILVGVAGDIEKKYSPPPIEFVETDFRTVRDAISDLEDVTPFTEMTTEGIPLLHKSDLSELAKDLRGSILYNHICTASTDIALQRFSVLKEGQNFHDLKSDMKATYSNAERTQNTIYMRLSYDQPSGTVVNVRKSMWIHPVLDRAVSIREAARLQTFPDGYIFEGSKDSQYQQVGNAVPPILATAIAKQILKVL